MDTPTCQTLEIIGDDIREENETFTVMFMTDSDLDSLMGASTATVTVTIQNNIEDGMRQYMCMT